MKTPLNPYPLTIEPQQGESLRSCMHRLMLRNKTPYFNWLMTDLGVKNIFTPLTTKELNRFSVVSGIPVDDLVHRQHSNAAGETIFQGEHLTPSMVDRQTSRLCLLCFRDRPFHRSIWEFTPIGRCPIHGTPLVSHCLHCGAHLHWRRNNLGECPAGDDLVSTISLDDCRASDTDLAGVRVLCERLGYHDGWSSVLPTLSAEIKQLPVRDLADMLAVLGCFNPEQATYSRRGRRAIYDTSNYHLILARGLHLLRDWPTNLHEVLDQFPGEIPGLFLAAASKCRQRLHRALSRTSQRAFSQILSRELWAYAEMRGVTLSPGAFGFTPVDFTKTFVASTEARKTMQVAVETMQRIAVTQGWSGASQVLTGKTSWLRRSDIDGWRQRSGAGQTAKELSQRFHISIKTILAAARRGLFGSTAKDRKPLHRGLCWYALPSETDAFIASIQRAIPAEPNKDSGVYQTWMGFTKRPESKHICFPSIIEGVMKGTVKAISLEGEDLTTLKFSLIDALELASALTRAGANMDEVGLSLRAIERLYHVEYLPLMQAIRLGLLRANISKSSRGRYWVAPRDMEAFIAQFTTAGRLARRLGKPPPSVARLLRKAGITPFGASDKEKVTARIYALADLRAVGLDRLTGNTLVGLDNSDSRHRAAA